MVVLPEDSGPKISQMRPRGKPPIPSAESTAMDPVEITETGTMASFEPSRKMEPFPNCFSIWLSVSSRARARSLSSIGGNLLVCGGGEQRLYRRGGCEGPIKYRDVRIDEGHSSK